MDKNLKGKTIILDLPGMKISGWKSPNFVAGFSLSIGVV